MDVLTNVICTNCITIEATNITVYTCSSNCVPVSYQVGFYDSCCTNNTLTSIPPSGSCFPVGTTTVANYVFLGCYVGYVSSPFTVTVIQSTNSPANCLFYECPTNPVVYPPCGSGCVLVSNYPPVFATNYCNPTNLTVSYSITLPYCFPVGTTPVVMTVSGSGQTNTCPFMVIVPTNNYNQLVFSDLTMSDPGNWTSNNSYGTLNNNPIDNQVNWGVGYTSALGVPQDPYSLLNDGSAVKSQRDIRESIGCQRLAHHSLSVGQFYDDVRHVAQLQQWRIYDRQHTGWLLRTHPGGKSGSRPLWGWGWPIVWRNHRHFFYLLSRL